MKKLLFILSFFATSAFSAERVIINPDQDGDLKLKVNKAGTATDAISVQGSTASVGLGTTTPNSYFSDADDFVISGTGNKGISIISGATSKAGISFGLGTGTAEGAGSNRGKIWYDMNTDSLNMSISGGLYTSPPFKVSGSGITVGNNSTGDSNFGTINSVSLERYTEGQFQISFTGPRSITVDVKYVRVGDLTTFSFTDYANVACTSATTFSAASAIPANLRPGIPARIPIFVQDNSVDQVDMGQMVIQTNGTVSITKTFSGTGNFTGSNNCGFYARSFSYQHN